MFAVQELHLFLCSTMFTSSIFSVHSSTSLSGIFFLHLHILLSKYSPTSHDLSHSHSQLLGLQIIFIASTFLNQFFTFTPAFIIISALFIITNTFYNKHLAYIYPYTFHVIACVLFH